MTDDYADPPETTDRYYTERLVRLPKSFFCYRPSPDSPPVMPLPATANGHITFGAFNNPAKVTPEAIAVWSQILSAVPESRLLLLVADCEARNQYAVEQFQQHGIEPAKLEFVGRRPRLDYLAFYQRVDIALGYVSLQRPCHDLRRVMDGRAGGDSFGATVRFAFRALLALKMKSASLRKRRSNM